MMTNERAKEELQELIAMYWIGLEAEHIEALEKAIKVLEKMEHYEALEKAIKALVKMGD